MKITYIIRSKINHAKNPQPQPPPAEPLPREEVVQSN